ncbi:ran-specific GTPase-activating protein-like isoform X2 [Sycon ciliatum]|uniref:ran-specific GTPase-activating protein-like isoform X2 n=1 Tax=Sycon ciliatum TaxID=27933 RepID=UPI0020AC7AD2
MSAAEGEDQVAESPNVDFTPVVRLPEVEVKTLEEDEEELFKIRARLFRYAVECDPPEWKERGTGDVRLLKKEGRLVRLVMRRDKTLKICANHYVTAKMELRPNRGSDRAWLYTTMCDFADEESKSETLAIRFANSTNANAFKTAFESAQEIARQVDPNGEDDGEVGNDSEHTDDEKDESNVSEKTEEVAASKEAESAAATATSEEKAEECQKSAEATEEVTEKLKEMAVADGEGKTESESQEGS